MANNSITNAMNAEQLMLSKMDMMRQHIQPEFVVSANPLDRVEMSNNTPLSFSQAVTNVLDAVNAHQSDASAKMTAVELGQSDDLVGAMVASQKASLSFNALMQVRNKVVSSIDEIMKMPV
ncbi:flagellar hook-basal body complex protein FliE [Enterovibrio sp. ZSDZ35]|uniref:Flagellar hook-basal body complex protein FliE n=1 Tax=Enterovibrio qingdaonensis TaxID=2899818 RepID=A0ABT5QMS0_9GAMM|nr:flagellar hook-basal body complex protein FliE [Enterovibrio sp. ZSDZ35]MDD1781889.1 flagellar hook-basal body complex protein FliE [Enterovibrio sp. ZSDZ35]